MSSYEVPFIIVIPTLKVKTDFRDKYLATTRYHRERTLVKPITLRFDVTEDSNNKNTF